MQSLVPKNTVLIIKWQNKKFSGWNWTFRSKYLILTDSHLHISINSIKSYIHTHTHTYTHTRARAWEKGFSGGSVVKKSVCQRRRYVFDPWVGKIPWRREWLHTPVFLLEESHGQKSLVGCSPWDCKMSWTWLSD